MISSQHAHLLISKYRSERTLLRISFIARDMCVNMRLTAKAREDEEPPEQLTFEAENGDFCLTVLTDCKFEYGDAREVENPAIRAASQAKFEGCLTVLFPNKERLYIMEMRQHV